MIRLALLSLAACGIASAAPLATEARPIGDFHAVELRGTLDVHVRVGGARHVEVTGDADVLSRVTTEVRDGVLVISTHGEFRSEHHIDVAISMPALDAVSLTGTGKLDVTDVAGPKLAVALSGTGDIALAGNVGEAAYQLHGTGGVRAKELAAKSAIVALEGTGSIALRASDSVQVALSGVGSVDVFGHPKAVTKSSGGLGRINVHD
jgi:hypothetical protein